MIPGSRQRNYLQSALYVIIVGIVATLLLERLLTYAEAAEKATVEATLGRLQSALYTRLAYLTLRGEHEAIDALRDKSPFVTADLRATNYLGEFVGVPVDAAGGSWLYDQVRKELVYVPNLKRYLVADPGEPSATNLRFRLLMLGASSAARPAVFLQPVTPYRWEPLS